MGSIPRRRRPAPFPYDCLTVLEILSAHGNQQRTPIAVPSDMIWFPFHGATFCSRPKYQYSLPRRHLSSSGHSDGRQHPYASSCKVLVGVDLGGVRCASGLKAATDLFLVDFERVSVLHLELQRK